MLFLASFYIIGFFFLDVCVAMGEWIRGGDIRGIFIEMDFTDSVCSADDDGFDWTGWMDIRSIVTHYVGWCGAWLSCHCHLRNLLLRRRKCLRYGRRGHNSLGFLRSSQRFCSSRRHWDWDRIPRRFDSIYRGHETRIAYGRSRHTIDEEL